MTVVDMGSTNVHTCAHIHMHGCVPHTHACMHAHTHTQMLMCTHALTCTHTRIEGVE